MATPSMLLSSAAWHDYWKNMVPTNQREQRRGAHIADIVTIEGCVVEVQHASMSPTKIGGRELDHGHMVWLWDARSAYLSGQLTLTGVHAGLVTFRWRNHRRNLRACRRTIYLDLGHLSGTRQRAVLKVLSFGEDGMGTGHLLSHHALRLWMTCGISPRPLASLPDEASVGA
ncbi:hypothetical protein ACWC5C_38600 [Streptomyces sp. NPDC001700]